MGLLFHTGEREKRRGRKKGGAIHPHKPRKNKIVPTALPMPWGHVLDKGASGGKVKGRWRGEKKGRKTPTQTSAMIISEVM